MIRLAIKFSDWVLILNSVKTPLGFFALVALIIDGILLVTATLTDKVSILAPLGLLGLLIVCVSLIIFKNPNALSQLQKKPVTVNLLFPDLSIDEFNRLELLECLLEIRDEDGLHTYKPNLTQGLGKAMTFQLTEDVGSNASAILRIAESEPNGRKWKTQYFNPYNINLESYKVGER